MGIYDRDYYRNSTGGFLESISRTGRICKWLIIINVVVFVIQLFTRVDPTREDPFGIGPFTNFLLLDSPSIFYYGQVWRLLTCAFLHNPVEQFPTHILFNMLLLWWFGKELESIYGSKEFLTFYLCAAVLSSLVSVAFDLPAILAGGSPPGALGASGAVNAVMVVFAFHYPRRIVYFLFFIPMQIWLVVVLGLARDLYGLVSGNNFGIAVEAHLGGALFGFLYYRFGWRLSPFFTQFRLSSFKRRKGPRLRVYREEDVRREPVAVGPPKSAVDEQLEAKIDAILQKIQTSGQDSLTPSERELLMRASEVYKKKRSSDD